MATMVDLDAYFARIGYEGPRTPTLATLKALHALHPAAIPFESLDVFLGRDVSLDPADVDAKLIHGGRGGYCFEQNSLFRRVLDALGFETVGHAGRVRWNMPEEPVRSRTHMVVQVQVEGQAYLCDVGFGGCILTAPIPLTPGAEHVTAHDTYRLVEIREGVRLETRREAGWLPAWDLSLDPCVAADYEMANWYTSTYPTSHFKHLLIAARTTPEARYAIRGNRYAVRPVGGAATQETLDADGIEHHLRTTFGLAVEPDWRPHLERAAAYDGV